MIILLLSILTATAVINSDSSNADIVHSISIDDYGYIQDDGQIFCNGTANTPFVNILVRGESFTSVIDTEEVKDGKFSSTFTIAGPKDSQNSLKDGIYELIVKYTDVSASKRFSVGSSFVIDQVDYEDGKLIIEGFSSVELLQYVFDKADNTCVLSIEIGEFSEKVQIELPEGDHTIKIYDPSKPSAVKTFDFKISKGIEPGVPSNPEHSVPSGSETNPSVPSSNVDPSSGSNGTDRPSNPSQGGNSSEPDGRQEQSNPNDIETLQIEDGKVVIIIVPTESMDDLMVKINEVTKEINEQSYNVPKIVKVELSKDEPVISLENEVLKALSNSGLGLELSSERGLLKLSEEVLDVISDKGEVRIEFRDSASDRMNSFQKNAVSGNATVIELKITSGEQSLGNSLSGTLNVTVKHHASEGCIPIAYYIDEDGNKEDMHGIYDSEKGEMSFETAHCSIYAIVDEEPIPSVPAQPQPILEPSQDGDDNVLMCVVLFAVISVFVVVICIFVNRRT